MLIPNKNCTCNDNYVYLNKIFYNETENSSPIMSALNTIQSEFTQQLTIGSNICSAQTQRNNCSCGCCNCDCCCDFLLGPDTVFNITNTYVLVRAFSLANPNAVTTEDITIDGLPITNLSINGSQFIGGISGIMPEITKCACRSACSNECTGNFVMITADGPWQLVATIVVEGTVYGNGSSCQFKVCFNTTDGAPLSITGPASFAFCGVDIPCQISGISPSLIFDFGACAKLLNPSITVNCVNDNCVPVLTGSLVITPTTNLQITRASLFNLTDYEVKIPCDDVGQCNPCDLAESQCIDRNIACQCCDTNGYGF